MAPYGGDLGPLNIMETKKRNRGPKIARLTSVARCGVEIGKLYRLMRRGELKTFDGLRMCQTLLGLKACLETTALEERIAELEMTLSHRESVPFRQRLLDHDQHRTN
jgi:hypothetical protein